MAKIMKKNVKESTTMEIEDRPDEHDYVPIMESIDPATAEKYLGKNYVNNRNLIPVTVARYAEDMANDRWRPIGDPLRFDKNDNMIDGQHRMHAVVISKKTIRFPVIRGLEESDIHVIDTGRARRPGDMLRILGFKNGSLRAGALRVMLHIKAGPLTSRSISSYTSPEIREAAFRHQDMDDSCAAIKHVHGVRPSVLVAFHYIGARLLDRQETADEFLEVIRSGKPSYDDDAAHRLREKMIANRLSGKVDRWTEVFSIRAAAHVWNLFSNKQPMRIFRIPESVAIDGLDTNLI